MPLLPTSLPPRPPTPTWVRSVRAEGPCGIAELFNAHVEVVERMIGRLVGPTADLEDLVQTTFVESIRALPRFRGEATFRTWICSIAVHVAQHHLRGGRVRRHVALEAVPEEVLGTAAPERDLALDLRRLAPRLHALLDRISPPKRVALLLYVIEERPVAEVAALMGASQTATRSRVFFARRELRKLIAQDPVLTDLAEALFERRRCA